ncbi:MAG: response regulator [Planctomycetota bacterium]|jgi:two-component system alkaline phosphatase synthesis response regulator PhoP
MLGLFKSRKKTAQARILVIDDEPDLVSTIQCRLEWCNCEVITAGNGKEGLEKAANEKPDLILLDTNMPVMSGHDMLERLREQPELKDIPVIMVTVVCEPQDIAIASSYGVVDYVTKPFDFTDLIEKIANALKNKKVLQLTKTNS